jgi:hypothetical protein
MHLTLRLKAISSLTVGLALGASGCGDSSSDESGVTPGDVEQLLQSTFSDIPVIADAFTRLSLALDGTPQPGVTLTPITNGFQGSVALDFDGNGSMEATVHGRLVLTDPNVGIAGGATLTITSIQGAATDGTLTVGVVPFSATGLAFGPGSGEFDPPGSGNILTIDQIFLTADISQPTPLLDGFGSFAIEDEPGDITVRDDGNGGIEITVTFGGETFTIP